VDSLGKGGLSRIACRAEGLLFVARVLPKKVLEVSGQADDKKS